jgi:hypothetical protein
MVTCHTTTITNNSNTMTVQVEEDRLSRPSRPPSSLKTAEEEVVPVTLPRTGLATAFHHPHSPLQ